MRNQQLILVFLSLILVWNITRTAYGDPLLTLVEASGSHLTPEQRADLATRLTEQYVLHSTVLAGLRIDQLRLLVSALDNVADGPQAADQAILNWMVANRQWQAFDPVTLATLVDVLGNRQGSPAVREYFRKAVDILWAQHLAGKDLLATAPVATVTSSLGPAIRWLSSQQQAELRDTFRQELLQAPRRLTGFSGQEVSQLEPLATALGISRTEWQDGVARWLLVNPGWRKGRLIELIRWIQTFAHAESSASSQGLHAVVEHAWLNYLYPVVKLAPDAAAVESLNQDVWYLVRVVGKHLDVERRSTLRRAMESTVQVEGFLSRLSSTRLVDLHQGLLAVGASPPEATQIVVTWIAQNSSWREGDLESTLVDVERVLTALPGGGDYAVRTARQRVLDHVWSRYLHSDAQIHAHSLTDLARIVVVLGPHYTQDGQQYLAGQLLRACTDKQASIGSLNYYQIKEMTRLFRLLNQADSVAMLLGHWLTAGPPHDEIGVKEFAQLAGIPGYHPSPTQMELVRQANGHFLRLHNRRRLNMHDYAAVVRLNAHAHQRDESVRWIQRAYQHLLAGRRTFDDLTADDIEQFALAVVFYQGREEGAIYPGFPEYGYALAAIIPYMRPNGDHYAQNLVLATPLAYEQSRQVVVDLCNSPIPQVRTRALQVMATYHRMAGSLRQWQYELDARIDDRSITEDDRALLLVGRAYAREIEVWDREPLSGRAYFERALSEARSETVYYVCAEQLAIRYGNINEHGQAEAILLAAAARITQPELVQQQQFQLRMTRARMASRPGTTERQQALAEKKRLMGRIELLEAQLRLSRERNRPGLTITKLEEAINQAKAELSALN